MQALAASAPEFAADSCHRSFNAREYWSLSAFAFSDTVKTRHVKTDVGLSLVAWGGGRGIQI